MNLELEKELKTLERELLDTNQILQDLIQRRNAVEKRVKAVRNQIHQARPPKLVVSDHAILRDAERQHGFPFEAIKKEVEQKVSSIKDVGNLKFAGWVIRGHTVVTFLPDGVEG